MAGATAKNDIPMFLAKLWNLVDDPNTDALIGWNSTGTSFVVQDPGNFAKHLLPQYFKHRNMASFIRVLNMYGFRKVIKLNSGSLQNVRDEMEFQHPCFVRGNEQLLICIKRKPASAPATQASKSLSDGPVPAIASSKGSEQEITKVLNDVRVIRGKQETMDVKLSELKRENESMWAELQDLRSKHAHQQIVVNKLIEFFITLLHNSGNTSGSQIRAPPSQLAIQTVLDGPSVAKRARLENNNGSSPEDYQGPIIRDVTEAWSAAYPQQAPEIVDWDRLLSDGSSAAGQQEVLKGLRTAAGTRAALPPVTSHAAQTPLPGTDNNAPVVPHTALSSELVDFLLNLLARPNPLNAPAPNRTNFVAGPMPQTAPLVQQQQPLNHIMSGTGAFPLSVAPLGSQIIAALPLLDGGASSTGMIPQQVGVRSIAPTTAVLTHGNSGANLLNGFSSGLELNDRTGAVTGARMEQQVETIQSNLEYIRDLLQNQNPGYNLDWSQINQLFPETLSTEAAVASQPTVPNNQANEIPPYNNWSQNSDNALMEYQHPEERQNQEDNEFLSAEDHEDFLSVFNSLPEDDDLIEGVTIQIPENSSPTTETSIIPLPSADSRNSIPASRIATSSSNNTGAAKRKRKS